MYLRHRLGQMTNKWTNNKAVEDAGAYCSVFLFYIQTNEHRLRGHARAERKKHKDEIMIYVGIQLC